MEEGSRPAPGAFSILHMDDDPAMREITGLMLRHRGHRVVSCCNVDATVAAYREQMGGGERFDLVVLDLSIPGEKGGVEGLREILAIDPDAKIVACSGAGPTETGELDGGFLGFVEKPFTVQSLDAMIDLISPGSGECG